MKYKSKERTRTYLSRLDITNVIVVYVCIENEYEYDPSWHAALHNIYLYVKPHYILLRLIKKNIESIIPSCLQMIFVQTRKKFDCLRDQNITTQVQFFKEIFYIREEGRVTDCLFSLPGHKQQQNLNHNIFLYLFKKVCRRINIYVFLLHCTL